MRIAAGLRATVHGAIIIYPKRGSGYPFPKPDAEIPIILGVWWKKSVMEIPENANRTGGDPILSDAYTINGQPGYLYPCSRSASVNNITYVHPSIDFLQAYYYKIPGVYEIDFPINPPKKFNYTADDLPEYLLTPSITTSKVLVLEYNSSVELILQGTNVLAGENHPLHLHGYSFYVVGWGFGNFDHKKDPLRYNLIDPPEVSTVGVPKNGWVALRFRAVNPGENFFSF
ncbi:putative Laccase [Quillaja saponaria]|uniref:Laccase n=1 Tax=Quillaja saponaria TaxID=32244 RepID=A0AAD7KNN7_QUISA|nr:putative Laccase [Quillaja saponaria]